MAGLDSNMGGGLNAPMLALPMGRTSMLGVPMTRASGLSAPTSRQSGTSLQVPQSSRARRSSISGAASRNSAGYKADVRKAADSGMENMDALVSLLEKPDRGGTRISYTNVNRHVTFKSVKALLEEADKDSLSGKLAVCVIENISPSLVKTLGSAWDLEPEFFAAHASNPPQHTLWDHRGEWKQESMGQSDTYPNFDCLEGIYEFDDLDLEISLMQRSSNNYCHRHVFKDGDWPVSVSTKITYMRVSSTFYLFLVDPPIRYVHAIRGEMPERALPTIRFPYAQNRGGVLLPSPWVGKHFIPFDSLERIFRHSWQLELLFQEPDLFPNVPLLYLMSFSLWYSKLHKLDREIKRISFYEIQRPNLNITDTLHEFREALLTLSTAVSNNSYYAPLDVHRYFSDLWQDFPYGNMLTPIEGHKAVSQNALLLHQFLLETFQLLLTTITTRDSQWGIRQAHEGLRQSRHGMILTRLAAFYLPWTLASGIYGMNLAQLNGTGLPIWTFCLTGFVLVLGTILVFSLQSVPKQPTTIWGYFSWTWLKGWFQNIDEDYDFTDDMQEMPSYYTKK